MIDRESTEGADYEAPQIVRLGSVEDLTKGKLDADSVTTTGISDRILKQEIAPLEDSLARLRSVQTR